LYISKVKVKLLPVKHEDIWLSNPSPNPIYPLTLNLPITANFMHLYVFKNHHLV